MTELLLAASLINQNPTVQIPVDTTKLEIQVPVDTTFTDSRGVKWELKGTLLARPAPASTTTTPSASTGPIVHAYRDLEGQWLSTARPGQRFLVVGSNMGESGEIAFAANVLAPLSWSDGLIVAEVPAMHMNTPPATITVKRADGAHYTGLAFGIKK